MDSAVRLRPARPDDRPHLVPPLTELCAGGAEEAERVLDELLAPASPGHEVWVAAAGRGAVGLLALAPSSRPEFRVGSVDWIAVAASWRRKGLGRLLLELGQRRARELGWRQLHVCTFHTNRASLHLYIACGFYPLGLLPDYAGPGLHYVELCWPVPPQEGLDSAP